MCVLTCVLICVLICVSLYGLTRSLRQPAAAKIGVAHVVDLEQRLLLILARGVRFEAPRLLKRCVKVAEERMYQVRQRERIHPR